MADLEINLDGFTDLERKLARVNMFEILRGPMMRAVLRLQSRMATYPPPPPGSKYRRTGALGRRWVHELQINSDSIVGKIGNNTQYGPYVQSEQFQARWMRHWTNTDAKVINAERHAIINDFEVSVRNALEDL